MNTYQNQQPVNTQPVVKPKSMVYHYIFSIYLIMMASSALLFSVLSLILMGSSFTYFENVSKIFITGAFLSMIPWAIYNLLTGIFLLARKRIGYLLQKIHNITAVICCSIYCAITITLGTLGYVGAVNELETFTFGVTALSGFSVLSIVIIDLLTVIYYNKRKHMFPKKSERR